jgi:adhesin/invasin
MTRKVALSWILLATAWLLFCARESPLELEKSRQSSVQLLLVRALPAMLAPGDSAVIQVRVVSEDGRPRAGEPVQFEARGGQLTTRLATTDSSGIAGTVFIAGSAPSEAQVTARCGNAEPLTVTLRIRDRSSAFLLLTLEPSRVLADGQSVVRLRAYLTGESGDPRKGELIAFSAPELRFSASSRTDSSGVASASLTAPASPEDLECHIVAEAGALRDTAVVLFLGVEFRLEAQPDHIPADGTSEARITATVKEARSKLAISGVTIAFATDLGTIPGSAKTDASGVAEVKLRSGTRTGLATVVGTFGNALRDTVRVRIGTSGPAYLSLRASPSVLPADGRSAAELTATVTDSSNNPVPDGTVVRFELISGRGTVEGYKSTTKGVAISRLVSDTRPGEAIVRAVAGSAADTVTVRYSVGEVASIRVVADSASIVADGVSTTYVRAFVFDAAGNPVGDGLPVTFESNLGNITDRALTQGGVAVASFSGIRAGVATIIARAGDVEGHTIVVLRPGPPNSILLSFDPKSVGVRDSGRNQTLQITAEVRDARNNPVADGTYVRFEIIASPGGGESLSTYDPVPTVNGLAQVSFTSGTRSGPVRIRAVVTDRNGNPALPEVRSTATEFLIHSGPPYMENSDVPSTSHLSVGANPINVLGWGFVNNTVDIVVLVGDKYNNPVPAGTAVYFTTTGGVIATHTGFTDDDGVAHVTLRTGQPYPTVDRFHYAFTDPNTGGPIPGSAFDFDGDGQENNGVARVLAVTEGVDAQGRPVKVWHTCAVVFSGPISTFLVSVDRDTLYPGESATVSIVVHDENGNPIVPGSRILAEAAAGKLSWNDLTTDDPGRVRYTVTLTNNLDPTDPEAKPTATPVTVRVQSRNGNVQASTPPIMLLLRRP